MVYKTIMTALVLLLTFALYRVTSAPHETLEPVPVHVWNSPDTLAHVYPSRATMHVRVQRNRKFIVVTIPRKDESSSLTFQWELKSL